MYLTPARYRTMGFGVDLSSVTDVELRSILSRASDMVDALCAVPRLPQKFDFRGGTITGERHEWYIDPHERPHPYQFRMFHRPVTSVTQFRIYSTPGIYVQIPPSEMLINISAGYVEIASLHLTQFGIWGAGMVPFVGLYYPIYEVDYTYGYAFAVVDETIDATDGTYTKYQAQNQFWVTGSATVKKNGTVQSSGFTVDETEGSVKFGVALASTDVVKVSYTYTLPSQIATATGLITTTMLGERALTAKGMTGVGSLTVAEVRITRGLPRSAHVLDTELDPEVATLLEPFIFRTVR